MREFPVFIPYEGDHLAAVVTVPDRERPRGLVLLSNVPGSPRSHRYQLWARAAERLAAIGAASVRWEYAGLDDSTGSSEEMTTLVTPVDQALAVARFVQRALGVEKMVAAGNCLGAQTALTVAAEASDCVGAVCILPPVIKQANVRQRIGKATRRRGVLGFLQANRTVRRFVLQPIGRFGLRMRPQVSEPLGRALRHARVVFVYDQEHLASRSRAFPKVDGAIKGLPEGWRRRFELRILPSRGLDRFGSAASQEAAIAVVVEWAERCLPNDDTTAVVRSSVAAPTSSSPARGE